MADPLEEGPPHGPGVDPDDYRATLARVEELFASMVERAAELSVTRCPYRNRLDECTAAFGCRNQRRRGRDEPTLCAGDEGIDYRSAWETQ